MDGSTLDQRERRSARVCRLGASLFILLNSAAVGEVESLPAPVDWQEPVPAPTVPGPAYTPPIDPSGEMSENAPRIYERTADAGPDQTFFVVGAHLTEQVFVWGRDADAPGGRRWEVKTPLVGKNSLAATLPGRSPDSVFLVWVGNEAGWSRPFRLNVPQPWWYWPKEPTAGSELRIFGRDLARRPDRTTAFVYLAHRDRPGRWLDVTRAEKYTVTVRIPPEADPGDYQLWVYAGSGGQFGWGEPLAVRIPKPSEPESRIVEFECSGSDTDGSDLKRAIEKLATDGGGIVKLGAGVYPFQGTLRIPDHVTLAGAGMNATRLQLVRSDPNAFAPIANVGWNRAPGAVHTPGDTMEYRLDVPASGLWTVWLRYATEMSKWNLAGVSGHMTLQVDDAQPVPLENLPNTGGFGVFRWSRSATLKLAAGAHTLRWTNVKGGGISLDAYVFALAPEYNPHGPRLPVSNDRVLVLQGENVVRFATKEGRLAGDHKTAVWLAGDGAAVRDLTISGTPQVNHGIIIRSPMPRAWITGCRVERCRISDIERKRGEICGVRLFRASGALVRDNEIWGRTPLYLSGVRHCDLSANKLVPVTRFGGNSEAAIQGRNETIEGCIIERNIVASPPGAGAGGPQTRRLIWVSTGHGSVTHNWFARNGVEPPAGPGAAIGAGPMRFGGVAGTEQNVGEMILFEANHRTMYFGPLAGADRRSVTLPETLPPTPEERLGSVKREQLAHNGDGKETPFWPPDVEDGSPEPPIGEYFVSVFQGPGQGQTRRVVGRRGPQLTLRRPWRTPPTEHSIVAVGTGFFRNLIVGNYVPDGMTGIQLWISCMENVVAENTIARMRRPALFLYANGTTLASSMPRTWNRGISPLFFNHVEGNRARECSGGVLVTSGDYAGVPVEFPRAVGNVIRHNSFVGSRNDGVVITSRKRATETGDVSPSILGTIVEFNIVRDARIAYHAGQGSDAVLFRRNHAYFWYPVDSTGDARVAFQLDDPGPGVVMQDNTVEGRVGELKPKNVVPLRTPKQGG